MTEPIALVHHPDEPACSFCLTRKLGRVVICNTPEDTCFICADCIDTLSTHLGAIRAAMEYRPRWIN